VGEEVVDQILTIELIPVADSVLGLH
jgi:hypothetical protein